MATKKEVSAVKVTAPEAPVTAAPAAPAPVVGVSEERVAALEAKVDDLIARLARKMSF